MMTKNMLWAALSMTAALVMTACSSDDNDIVETPAAPQAQKTIPYTVTVSDDATTRATVSDDPTDRKLYFATGDKLYITGTGIQGVLDLKAGDAGKATGATFSGELTYTGGGTPAEDLELTATLVSAQQTEGTQVSVDDEGAVTVNYPTAAYCATISDAVQQYSRLTGTSTYGAKAFTLTQQTAFLNFVITFEDGTATGKTLPAKVSNGGSAVCTANVTTATESGKVVAKFVLPVAAGTTLSSATVTMGGKAAIAFGASQTLTGKVYNVKKTQAPTDLSMVDCAGNARANGMSTANCYMVHTAGKYKLPLVYGNAIKAGETNANAYTGVSGSNTTATFPRHDGQAINAPWIKDNGITVTTAELLWQDAQGLITAVGIDGDYLTLTVGKDATSQEGNALIAAKNAEGTIVWSWHIWVTKETFENLCKVNTDDHTYQVTLVNLGWVGAERSTGYNTYYEWGRKDPFIPGTGTTNGQTDHTVYDINGATVTEGFTYSTEAVSLDGFIKNPTTFYRANNGNNSSLSTAHNLWDAHQTSNSNNIATATVKTVYDPCPAGFCVPTGNLYKFLNTGYNGYFAWVDEVKAIIMQRNSPFVYFPASGNRGRTNGGKLSNVGIYGYYWSASASANDAGHTFYFNYGTKLSRTWGGCYRANGFSVRAVVEE